MYQFSAARKKADFLAERHQMKSAARKINSFLAAELLQTEKSASLYANRLTYFIKIFRSEVCSVIPFQSIVGNLEVHKILNIT